MTRNGRWIGAIALALALPYGRAGAQFYGGGYWGEGYGGVGTPQSEMARGAGLLAMGLGRYNLDTAKANAIDAETVMRWNQYVHRSRIEASRLFRERQARQEQNRRENAEAIRLRLRSSPNQVDIASGNALNLALDELSDPGVFPKAAYRASKVKLGGDEIRNIPFAYASAAISVSVQQLLKGQPPASLRRAEFADELAGLDAVVVELRKEFQELGEDKPVTIRRLRDQIASIRAKAEKILPGNSQVLRDAVRYLRALDGLASMLETPVVDVLLAGVENRPEATVGDLMAFMSAYNLRFGVATTPRQRQVYMTLQPILTRIRDEVIPTPTPEPTPTVPGEDEAPGAVFDALGDRYVGGKSLTSG